MSTTRVELAALANCLLLAALVAAGAGSSPNQAEETQNDLLANQFLRQAVESLEQEQFVRSSLGRADRQQQQQQQQLQQLREPPRGYMVVPEVDEEGRARRANRDQLLRSDIVDDVIDRIMRTVARPGRQPPSQEVQAAQQRQQQQQQQQPIFRLARDQAAAPPPEEPSDLSIPTVESRLLPDYRQPLLGLAWYKVPGDQARQQGSPAKRFQLNGLEFKNENQQPAEPQEARLPYSFAPLKKPQGSSRGVSLYSDDEPGQTNKTNGGGGGGGGGGRGKQNKFIKPDALLANMVGSSLEAKRVENSRWNNLRGMWGKRSVYPGA